jgi:glycosyltransferase involved in cell wall biosynthesis
VAIATRNRPEALALSLPLILGQSRQPKKLIVIDSSDDHAPVAETVARAVAQARTGSGWNGTVVVEHSEPGLPRQRNRSLTHVEADVVIFPDDDSLLHPGASEAIMRAYELDIDGRIAGVCAAEALAPPGPLAEAGYGMASEHKRQVRLRQYRKRLGLDFNWLRPTLYVGALLSARSGPLDWFEAENCVPVDYMAGFRMSFRSAVIKAEGFDETLTAYAVAEDVDASFAAMRHGCLVAARNARIYHHKFPDGRGDPYTLGIMWSLNVAYVVLKHVQDAGLTPAEARKARWLVHESSLLKILAGPMPSPHKRSGWDRLRGSLAALDGIKAMLNASREDLPRIYAEARARNTDRR